VADEEGDGVGSAGQLVAVRSRCDIRPLYGTQPSPEAGAEPEEHRMRIMGRAAAVVCDSAPPEGPAN